MKKFQAIFLKCLLFLLLVTVAISSLSRWYSAGVAFAWDYSINWSAAFAMTEGVSIYDQAAVRAIGIVQVGEPMATLFDQLYESYIGPPSTAMLLLPFTAASFQTSLTLYRAMSVLAYLVSISILIGQLPKTQRRLALLMGLGCFFAWDACATSVRLGQVDGLIVLALTLGLVAIHKRLFWLAGFGIGLATILKISPGLLLVYALLKRQWLLVVSATLTMLAVIGLSFIPGDGAELQRFVNDIAPRLSDGSMHVQNQALGAFLARLFSRSDNLLDFSVGMGSWRLIGIALVALALLWLRFFQPSNRGDKSISEPLINARSSEVVNQRFLSPRGDMYEYSLVILLAVIAGPISWDHYCSWALIPVTLLGSYAWRGGSKYMFFGMLLIMMIPLAYPTSEQVNYFWGLRLLTGAQTLALIGLFGLLAKPLIREKLL